jgi:hypothetical protein
MKEEKNIPNYSGEDIRKYLAGKLTGPEMHAIEKTALEDHFLADAIEGLEESKNHTSSFESDIADLQKKLAVRIHQKERKHVIGLLVSNWQIAASVLIVLGITVLISINRENAVKKIMPLPANSNASVKPTEPVIREYPKNVTSSKSKDLTKISRDKRDIPYRAEKTVLAENKPEVYTAKDLVTRDSVVFPTPAIIQEKKVVTSSVSSALSGKVSGLSVQNDQAPSENYIKGIILDDKGAPISGALVKFRGKKAATATDTNGFFKLYVKNNDSAREVAVNSAGYDANLAYLNPDSSYMNTVRLHPSSQSLNDVVVAGYGTQKGVQNELIPSKNENKNVEPENGWLAFYNYLKTNKKIPASDSVGKGSEIISFIVNNKGELSSFKIKKSISPGFDADLIRLIKEGPAWKIMKGKKQKVTVYLSFP